MIGRLWHMFGGSRMLGTMLLGVLIGGYTAWQLQKWRYDIRLARAQAAIVQVHLMQDQIADQTEREAHAHLAAIEQKEYALSRQIPLYIDQKSRNAQSVPTGFVHLYNATFTGQASIASTSADDESSRLSFTDLATVHISNASICQQWKEQALAWRAFYQALRAARGGK